jgi:hypothetical protein
MCFRSHERLPLATPSKPQAPLFGRRRFSYLHAQTSRHARAVCEQQQHCIVFTVVEALLWSSLFLVLSFPHRIHLAGIFGYHFVLNIYLICKHFPHSFAYDLFTHLRRASATARVLGLWVRIPTEALSGSSPWDRPILRPEESYWLCVRARACVVVCDMAQQ